MIDRETIRKTFIDDAVRTVMLIDNEFPTYADLHSTDEAGRWETERANALYQAFKKRKLLCDIENNVSNIHDADFDRIRKSDLIILDFNLQGENDSDDSIKLLQGLAKSDHFNLIVLYTKQELPEVWTRVAAQLRGGWRPSEELLEEHQGLYDLFVDYIGKNGTLKIDQEIVASYILRGAEALKGEAFKEDRDRLTSARIDRKLQTHVLEAFVHKHVREELKIASGTPSNPVAGNFVSSQAKWVRCGTVFIAFMHKSRAEEQDAEKMLDLLEEALTDWKPNVLNVLLSQIQNLLEMKAIAYDKQIFESEELQAGWIYHTLTESMSRHDEIDGLRQVIETLYERVLETISHNLMYKYEATRTGLEIFQRYLSIEKPDVDFEKRMQQSIALSGGRANLDPYNIAHALNRYLSTGAFHGDHITTGTIFYEESTGDEEWWVCTSPACDMVPRTIKDKHSWSYSLDPIKPMMAIRLISTNDKQLAKATQGRLVFLRHKGNPKCFFAVDPDSGQPRPAMFLLSGEPPRDGKFQASMSSYAKDKRSPILTERTYIVVGQLRPNYASRLLQQVGNHHSRIGVDFVDYGHRKAEDPSKK